MKKNNYFLLALIMSGFMVTVGELKASNGGVSSTFESYSEVSSTFKSYGAKIFELKEDLISKKEAEQEAKIEALRAVVAENEALNWATRALVELAPLKPVKKSIFRTEAYNAYTAYTAKVNNLALSDSALTRAKAESVSAHKALDKATKTLEATIKNLSLYETAFKELAEDVAYHLTYQNVDTTNLTEEDVARDKARAEFKSEVIRTLELSIARKAIEVDTVNRKIEQLKKSGSFIDTLSIEPTSWDLVYKQRDLDTDKLYLKKINNGDLTTDDVYDRHFAKAQEIYNTNAAKEARHGLIYSPENM